MLQRYIGFYMHKGERIRWDASASVTVYGVRYRPHRRPKLQPGQRLVIAPNFFLVVDEASSGFDIGHMRIQQPPDRSPYISQVAFFSVLSADIAARHGITLESRPYQRALVWSDGRRFDTTSCTPEEAYWTICALCDEESWI